MADWRNTLAGETVTPAKGTAAPSGDWRGAFAEEAAPPKDSGIGAGGVLAAGGAALAALLLKKPGLAKTIASKANAARQQVMLSGLALPKSILGNVGSGVEAAIETRSMKPLQELFSMQTARDAVAAFKSNTGLPGAAANAPKLDTLPGPMPGRFMGALDEATQKAHVRAGKTVEEAQSAALQAPLQGDLAKALDSPLARYLIPFRRTPFNQFTEGLKRLPGGSEGTNAAKAVYMGAGAAHGAATADDKMPVSLPLATAAASRYGLPYAAAAVLGRSLAGGNNNTSGIAGSMLPVSEYGMTSSIVDPTKPFRQPAALTAWDKLFGDD